MNDLVPAFEVALSDNNFKAVKEIWADLIKQESNNIPLLLALAEKVKKKNDSKKAASLLSLVLDDLQAQKNYEDSYKVSRIIANYNPFENNLFKTLIDLIPRIFSSIEDIDVIVTQGREKFNDNVPELLKFLDIFISYRPGDYVFHQSGWGFGTVLEVLPTDMLLIVDFEKKKNHQFKLTAADKMLRKLSSNHFLVWRETKIDELREMCKKDPVEVVKMILESENTELTQKDIKSRIVPDVLENKDWTKFLHSLKSDAQTDPYLQFSTGGNPRYSISEKAKLYEDVTLNKFKRAQGWQEKLQIAYEGFANTLTHGHKPDFLKEIAVFFSKLLEQNADSTGTPIISAILILGDISDKFPELGIEKPSELKDAFVDDDVKKMLNDVAKIQINEYQKRIFKNLKTWFPKSKDEILYQAFFTSSQVLWDESIKTCDKEDCMDIFDKAGTELTLNYDKYPDNFVWFVKTTFAHAKKDESLAPDVYHQFDLLLNLAFRLHHAQLRGDKQAKVILTKLKGLVANTKLTLLKFLLPRISEAEAEHLYNHINRTEVLGDIAKTKLKAEIKTSFKQFKRKAVTRSMPVIDTSKVFITNAGLGKLRAEIQHLQKNELPRIQKAIGDALEMGDISENAELDAAREQEGQLKAKLNELLSQLENHEILDENKIDTSQVSLGTKIEYEVVDSNLIESITIVGCTWDIDLKNQIISFSSPIGMSMLGAKVSDIIPLPSKDGVKKVKILKITNGIKE